MLVCSGFLLASLAWAHLTSLCSWLVANKFLRLSCGFLQPGSVQWWKSWDKINWQLQLIARSRQQASSSWDPGSSSLPLSFFHPFFHHPLHSPLPSSCVSQRVCVWACTCRHGRVQVYTFVVIYLNSPIAALCESIYGHLCVKMHGWMNVSCNVTERETKRSCHCSLN